MQIFLGISRRVWAFPELHFQTENLSKHALPSLKNIAASCLKL